MTRDCWAEAQRRPDPRPHRGSPALRNFFPPFFVLQISTTVLQIISGAVHSKWGSKGVAEEDTWRAECAWLRSNRDYDVRRVRGEPRGLNSEGSVAVRSSSRSARTEGEKRLLSATRKP